MNLNMMFVNEFVNQLLQIRGSFFETTKIEFEFVREGIAISLRHKNGSFQRSASILVDECETENIELPLLAKDKLEILLQRFGVELK